MGTQETTPEDYVLRAAVAWRKSDKIRVGMKGRPPDDPARRRAGKRADADIKQLQIAADEYLKKCEPP